MIARYFIEQGGLRPLLPRAVCRFWQRFLIKSFYTAPGFTSPVSKCTLVWLADAIDIHAAGAVLGFFLHQAVDIGLEARKFIVEPARKLQVFDDGAVEALPRN